MDFLTQQFVAVILSVRREVKEIKESLASIQKTLYKHIARTRSNKANKASETEPKSAPFVLHENRPCTAENALILIKMTTPTT